MEPESEPMNDSGHIEPDPEPTVLADLDYREYLVALTRWWGFSTFEDDWEAYLNDAGLIWFWRTSTREHFYLVAPGPWTMMIRWGHPLWRHRVSGRWFWEPAGVSGQ